MSIENLGGIEKISVALDRLQQTYKRQANITSQAAVDSFALDLSREEALRVLAGRVESIKAELGELGFSKPIIKIPMRGLDEQQSAFGSSNAQIAEAEVGRAQSSVA